MSGRRVAVLVEDAELPLLGVAGPEELAKSLREQGDVVVLGGSSWSDPTAAERAGAACEGDGIGSVVLCGPLSESSIFPDHLVRPGSGAPVPVVHAGVREQCGAPTGNGNGAARKALRLLSVAVARARGAVPPEMREVEVDRTVAVIGGNHAAYGIARRLVRSGYPVVMLRTAPPADCFYPLPADAAAELEKDGKVRAVEVRSVERIEGCVGAYRLEVKAAEGWTTVAAGR